MIDLEKDLSNNQNIYLFKKSEQSDSYSNKKFRIEKKT